MVINECYFKEDEPKKEDKKNNQDFEDDDFNPFGKEEKKSEASVSPKSKQGPAFKGLREFRTSIDANDPTRKAHPNTRNLGLTPKHRKFTLSFDGNNKNSQEDDDFFLKLDEGSSPVFKPYSFKMNVDSAIKEEDDASFEMNIEDDYFTEDLSDFNPPVDQSLQRDSNPFNFEKITSSVEQESDQKLSKDKKKNAELGSSQFESILYSLQQAVSDSSINKLNTSDDYCLFLDKIEKIRKRFDSQATDVSGESNISSNRINGSINSSMKNSEIKDTLLNNYIEIVELREQLKESTFDSILN